IRSLESTLYKQHPQFAHLQIRTSKLVLPHHTLNWLFWLSIVFGVFLFVVFNFYFPLNREVNELSNRHSSIYFNRLFYGNFQRPVSAKTNVTFAGCRMDVDAQSSRGRLTFQERNVGMCFRILHCDT